MAQSLRIDTLAFARRLKEAGADGRLAEAIAEGIGSTDISDLVTKRDLDVKIAELKSELLKWMFGAMAAQTALIVALLRLTE